MEKVSDEELKHLAEMKHPDGENYLKLFFVTMSKMAQELLEIRKENEALREDAERLSKKIEVDKRNYNKRSTK